MHTVEISIFMTLLAAPKITLDIFCKKNKIQFLVRVIAKLRIS